MKHPIRTCLPLLALLPLLCAGAEPGGAPSPFVAAFERFYADTPATPLAGRLLRNELGCTACHVLNEESAIGAKSGPVLDGIGGRIQAEWIRRFLNEPQAVKPGTTMPNLFRGLSADEKSAAIEALVHFLVSSTKSPWDWQTLPKFSNPSRGDIGFHEVGCVACHAPVASDVSAPTRKSLDAVSVPLPSLKQKYSQESLMNFLRETLAHRPAGRMPDFRLTKGEAADIAAFLLGRTEAHNHDALALTPLQIDPALVEKGKEIFSAMGCVQCHVRAGTSPAPKAKPWAELRPDAGCMATPVRGVPDFSLSLSQRKTLNQTFEPAEGLSAGQIVTHTLDTFNCWACHERDRRGGPDATREPFFTGQADLGNEGRFPPRLTGVGRKLTAAWTEKVLLGEGAVRPYIRTRMPVFAAAPMKLLPKAFQDADMTPADHTVSLADGEVESGRQLVGTQGGLACITCHRLRGRASLGMDALDLGNATERLQPAWFRQNLIEPAALRPGTLMPSFFEDGKSALTAIHDGDADRQIASIWTYLRDSKKEPEGYPSAQTKTELSPRDRPLLLRAFVEGVGTHAIAVGFPEKVNVGFDAASVRPALAWRGRFLDAYDVWFNRHQPPLKPLGTSLQSFPSTMPLARLSAGEPWPAAEGAAANYIMKGYRLDKASVPTFLYRFGSVEVEDRLIPRIDGGGLVRTLNLSGSGDGLWFYAGETKGLTIKVHEPAGAAGRIPIVFDAGKARIKVEYRW